MSMIDTIASQITSLSIVYSTLNSGADQRKQQSSVLLAIFAGNLPVTAQMASNGENVSIWWSHHELTAHLDEVAVSEEKDIKSLA